MSASPVSAATVIDSGPGQLDHRDLDRVDLEDAPARTIPAWLLSIMLHFAFVVSAALLFRAGTLTGTGESLGERGGEIVLYSSTNNSEKSYLTEEDMGGGAISEATTATSSNLAEALPAADAAPAVPGIGLPQAIHGSGAAAQASSGAVNAGNATRRLGPTGGRSGGAATSVFGAIGEGQRFVYVFDRSSSMSGAALTAAKRELVSSLAHLGDVHQFGIIFYNHNQSIFGSAGSSRLQLFFAKRENRILAEKFVTATPAQGATQHLPALKLALNSRPDVVFFLTDADDPVLTEEDLRKIRGWNVGTTIHAIQFGYGPKQSRDSFLEVLTSENGGMFRYVDVYQLPRSK